jgi:hypothetical protein
VNFLKKKMITIEKTPLITQTTKAMLTLPVYFSTPVGLTKIPEPIIDPTITVIPFRRLILALRVTSPWFSSTIALLGLSLLSPESSSVLDRCLSDSFSMFYLKEFFSFRILAELKIIIKIS